MKDLTAHTLAGLLLAALLVFASALSAQEPITYVDATHGPDGNTTMLDGSVWNPLEGDSAEGFWTTRPGFGNNGLVYQNAGGAFIQSNDAHPIVTSVTGLPEGRYDVFVYFWADPSAWRIRAALAEGDGDWPLFIARSEGVTQFYFGDDATVFSPSLEDDPFAASADNDGQGIMIGEGNRRLFQAYVGTVSGTEINVFIDDGPAPGQAQRTWYDGIGYAPAAPREMDLPFVADFGSVRFIDIIDQVTEEPFQLEPVTEGGTMFAGNDNTVTSLPAELAGNLAFKTLNLDQEVVLRFGGPEITRVETNVPTNDLEYPLSFGIWVNRFDEPFAGRNKLFGWFEPGATNRGEVEIVPGENLLRLVWWGGGPNITVSPPPSTNAWVHIGVVITPETARMYVDGVEVGALGEGVEPWGLTADTHLWIGARNDGSETSHTGWMKDWVLYDEDIGAEGMQQLADGEIPAGALLQHFPMNEAEGTVVFDQSGNDVHGDLIGPFVWEDTVPVSDDLELGIGFVTDRDITVYLAMDENMDIPLWMQNSYTNSGLKVETTAGDFDLWQRDFGAREQVSLPAVVRGAGENNRWVILSEGPDAITGDPEGSFLSLPTGDWSTGSFFRQASSFPDDELHAASMTAEMRNFLPESGFRLSSTVRVPRLQDEGDNAIGFHLLGGNGHAIRAEWLPRLSGGDSVIRFVDMSNDEVLAQESWTGLAPTRTDNEVGVSDGAFETVYSVGTPVFVEDMESVVFSEDFETGGAGWTMGSDAPAVDQWEIGVPTSGPGSAFSGNNVAATNLDGVYTTGGIQNTIAWLRSPEIDLRNNSGATLRFHEYLDVDELEINEELFHFVTVRVLEADSLNQLAQLAVYNTGISSWTERVLDLSVAAGNRVVLQFGLHTDEVDDDVGDGWYIDAVEVTATGNQVVRMPENLALDGTLNGISTERAGVDDDSDNHLQFTVEDRGVSGNEGVTVYVAWDIRASSMEPDWLTQNFTRTDHFVGVSSAAGFHRLWAREYADGEQVTLGGASAAGPGSAGLPAGTSNYFVLLGDARSGLETLYTLEATGSWEDDEGTLTFTVTDANGVSQSVQTMVTGDMVGRNEFGVAVRHPDANGGTVEFAPIWDIFSLAMEAYEEVIIDLTNFQEWREEHFEGQLDNPEVSGPNADPAGDGVPNLLKYALGLSPWVPAAAGDLPRIVPDGDNILILVYQERIDIDDIAYVPQVAEDLDGDAWNEGTPHVVEIFRGPGDSANTQEVRVRGQVSQGAPRGFLRLEVRLVE